MVDTGLADILKSCYLNTPKTWFASAMNPFDHYYVIFTWKSIYCALWKLPYEYNRRDFLKFVENFPNRPLFKYIKDISTKSINLQERENIK